MKVSKSNRIFPQAKTIPPSPSCLTNINLLAPNTTTGAGFSPENNEVIDIQMAVRKLAMKDIVKFGLEFEVVESTRESSCSSC